MSGMQPINPASLGAPRGYSNGMLAPANGRVLFVAGQIGWNSDQKLVGDGFNEQFAQALANAVAVVKGAGGDPHDIGRLTLYVTSKQEYLAGLKEIGQSYRELLGKHFPAMALVEVSDLLEPGAKVEIEATAVIPPDKES